MLAAAIFSASARGSTADIRLACLLRSVTHSAYCRRQERNLAFGTAKQADHATVRMPLRQNTKTADRMALRSSTDSSALKLSHTVRLPWSQFTFSLQKRGSFNTSNMSTATTRISTQVNRPTAAQPYRTQQRRDRNVATSITFPASPATPACTAQTAELPMPLGI